MEKFYQLYPGSCCRGRVALALVEILMVVAIVTVFLIVSIPVISTVQKKARVADSLSNLRQIGISTLLAVGDEGGILPFARGPGFTNDIFRKHLREYTESPDQKIWKLYDSAFRDPLAQGHDDISDYGVNHFIFGILDEEGANNRIPLADLEFPSRKVLFCTTRHNSDESKGSWWFSNDYILNPGGTGFRSPTDRETGLILVVHADGSAAAYAKDKFAADRRDLLQR